MENNEKMAITPKGLKYLLIGLIVMVSGYILMTGGGSDDPEVFNYAMFDFPFITTNNLRYYIRL